MTVAHRCLWRATRLRLCLSPLQSRKYFSQKTSAPETNSLGIPLKATWSVNDLLSSYPNPTLTHETLEQLHKLAALKPPARETPEYTALKKSMEVIIRLVEAVKLVDTGSVRMAEASYDQTHHRPIEQDVREPRGRDLLKYARSTSGEFYVVDTDANQ
ncbi:hypothetical protein HGRIS_009897 [Hohenbuehelia grisea]|uniref:Glutamyl-tRNA(Gln) amidotransferase subunit C, mitochondrial n=1 Tax=Hohenbuehelia grisea TaxID=104357 RepID=A0ABR3J2I7_9AGAR